MSQSKKLLLISSDDRLTANLKELLQSAGAVVSEAENIERVLANAMPEGVEVAVVALCAQQVETQWEQAQKLKTVWRVPLVFVGAELDRKALEQTAKGVFFQFLKMPTSAEELQSALEVALRLQQLENRISQLDFRMKEVHRLESIGIAAGGVAHEFNNIITAIFGSVSMAQAEVPAAAPIRQRLDHIERCATRAAELSQRLSAPVGQLKARRMISINEVVIDVLRFTQEELPTTITVQTGLADGLPPVHVVEVHMRQVLLNLITNAAEAIGNNPGTIRIVTFTKTFDKAQPAVPGRKAEIKPGDYVVLEVADSGCGIDPGIIDMIFDPAFSTKNTHRGLGLAAVWRIVEKHGGVTAAESSLGHGAFFRVYLPVHTTPPAVSNTSPGLDTAPALASAAARTILIVDDDDAVRELAKWVVQKAGHTAVTARDGDEAVRLVAANPARFDLVLLDLTMPRMGGIEATQKIRALRPTQPIVLVTGHGESVLGEDYANAGVGFMRKPFNPDGLRAVLKKTFGAG
ncbi:MAG: response regulator [Nibricoccus sp.]